jgi:carbon storage regulator
MLVLSRKPGETIIIGDSIRITIVAILGDKVRLGIAAPPEVIVDRQEIHDKRVKLHADDADTAIHEAVP